MKILGIDTSTKVLSLVLSEGDNILWQANRSDQLRHLEVIVPMIEKGLKRCKWKPRDIQVIASGIGPGSFTGLRVGLATVKGYQMVCNSKLLALSSLDIIAQNADIENEALVMIDARRGKVYGAFYSAGNGIMRKKGKDSIYAFETLVDRLKTKKKKICILGDGVRVYGEKLKDIFGDQVKLIQESSWYPSGKNIIKCVSSAIAAKQSFTSVNEIKPVYLQLLAAKQSKK